MWGTEADVMTSAIYQFSVTDANGNSNVTSSDAKVKLGFPNTAIDTSSVTQNISSNDTKTLLYHKLNVTSGNSALTVKLVLDGEADRFNTYISKGVMPTTTLHDVNMTSPATTSGGKSEVNVMVPASSLSGAGIYYIALEPISKYIHSN